MKTKTTKGRETVYGTKEKIEIEIEIMIDVDVDVEITIKRIQ